MFKIKIVTILITALLVFPSSVFALSMPNLATTATPSAGLTMPSSGNDLAAMYGIDAQAYVVKDMTTGQILINKNANLSWTPASLTKLITALVVLDTKPKLTQVVTMSTADQIAGFCSQGGACIKSKAGVKFTLDGLFHAALMPSANNAANALARSTGLTQAQFVARMNAKAASLGAINTHFNEPTGMDPTNQITAADYVNIVSAAFSNPYLQSIAGLTNFSLRSINNSGYNQTIKNTDKLLTDDDVQLIGAKTGYLDESRYNFAALLKYRGGDNLAVVVLGEPHLYQAFAETKTLASLAETAKYLAIINPLGQVLGASKSTPN